MRRIVPLLILLAAALPLVAACQKTYDERPAGELGNAEPCDCEETCPDCICEKEGKAPAAAAPRVEGDSEGTSPGGL